MHARLSFSNLLAGILAMMSAALGQVKPGSREDKKLRLDASNTARKQYQAQGDIRNAIAHRSSPAKRAKLRARHGR